MKLREQSLVEQYESSSTEIEGEQGPPATRDERSLVLDRSHPLSDLYYRRATYKIYWGGRGSAKSWGVAEALIRLAAAKPLRILCAREYQVSIKDSSHKLLKDTIYRLGLESWFNVTKESITSRAGAEFIFKGLHLNEQGVRSTEGIDITWVEEGQTVTAGSWRSLTPTVLRKDDAEIWVTYNLISEDDATHQRFVMQERPDSIVHKINYDSNPYFPSRLREEMETDKLNDFHLYEHIWLGMPLKISNAIVLSGRYQQLEFADDLWKEAERLLFGADFGFAQDPNTLLRMFMLPARDLATGSLKSGMDLYVEYEAYGTGVELEEMEEFYESIPGCKDWPIKADAARPETISFLKRKGFAISAAEKWEGSVKDGITHLRGFSSIYIHPRCKWALQEAQRWRYKVDKNVVDKYGQPQVLPVLVKGNDHIWDAARYGLDGYIHRGGALGMWSRLGHDPSETEQ